MLFCLAILTEVLKRVFCCESGKKISINIDENRTNSPPHNVWTSHEQWWRYAFINLPAWPETRHQGHREGKENLDRVGGCWETIRQAIGLYAIPHRQENRMLAKKYFLRLHHPKHLVSYPAPDCNLLDYYVCRMVERDTKNIPSNIGWTVRKEISSFYQVKQGDRWKGLQQIPKSFRSQGWSQLQF